MLSLSQNESFRKKFARVGKIKAGTNFPDRPARPVKTTTSTPSKTGTPATKATPRQKKSMIWYDLLGRWSQP